MTTKKAKGQYDTVKQIRLSQDTYDEACHIFSGLGMNFSEGIRCCLEEIVKRQGLPFRPSDENSAQKFMDEKAFLIDYLGIQPKETAEERLLRCIFGPENSKEMSDDDLRQWGLESGFPASFRLETLEDLKDSGLFASHPWMGKIVPKIKHHKQFPENTDTVLSIVKAQENLRQNLDEAKAKLLANGVRYIYEEYLTDYNTDTNEEDK